MWGRFNALDTVAAETLAVFATSKIVTLNCPDLRPLASIRPAIWRRNTLEAPAIASAQDELFARSWTELDAKLNGCSLTAGTDGNALRSAIRVRSRQSVYQAMNYLFKPSNYSIPNY